MHLRSRIVVILLLFFGVPTPIPQPLFFNHFAYAESRDGKAKSAKAACIACAAIQELMAWIKRIMAMAARARGDHGTAARLELEALLHDLQAAACAALCAAGNDKAENAAKGEGGNYKPPSVPENTQAPPQPLPSSGIDPAMLMMAMAFQKQNQATAPPPPLPAIQTLYPTGLPNTNTGTSGSPTGLASYGYAPYGLTSNNLYSAQTPTGNGTDTIVYSNTDITSNSASELPTTSTSSASTTPSTSSQTQSSGASTGGLVISAPRGFMEEPSAVQSAEENPNDKLILNVAKSEDGGNSIGNGGEESKTTPPTTIVSAGAPPTTLQASLAGILTIRKPASTPSTLKNSFFEEEDESEENQKQATKKKKLTGRAIAKDKKKLRLPRRHEILDPEADDPTDEESSRAFAASMQRLEKQQKADKDETEKAEKTQIPAATQIP